MVITRYIPAAEARPHQIIRREKIAENAKRRIEALGEARVILRMITEDMILTSKHLSVLWGGEATAEEVIKCLGYVEDPSYISWCITHRRILDTSALSRENKDTLRYHVEKVFGPLYYTNMERSALAMRDEELWMF